MSSSAPAGAPPSPAPAVLGPQPVSALPGAEAGLGAAAERGAGTGVAPASERVGTPPAPDPRAVPAPVAPGQLSVPPLPPSFSPYSLARHPHHSSPVGGALTAAIVPAGPPLDPSTGPPAVTAPAQNGHVAPDPLQQQQQEQPGPEAGPGSRLGGTAEPSLPVSILNAAPREPRDPFQGLTRTKDNKGVYAQDLAHDDQHGASASAPLVSFTADTVPNRMNVGNIASLGFGAIVSAAPSPPVVLPVVRRPGTRCERCGSYANLYCSVIAHTGEWRCPFCRHANSKGSEYVVTEGGEFASWPELSQRAVDYTEAMLATSPDGSDARCGPPLVLLLDECLDAAAVGQLQQSLTDLLSRLPPDLRLCIISFGASVSIYDLTQTAVARADVFAGQVSPTPASLEALFSAGVITYLAPLQVCRAAAQAVVSSLRPFRGGHNPRQPAEPRCLGVAVEYALAVIQGPPARQGAWSGGVSRVVVALGGPISVGPGAIPESERDSDYSAQRRKATKFLEDLGNDARDLDATIDILFGGATVPKHLDVLLPLSTLSGGVTLLLDGFGPASFGANALKAVRRSIGSRGLLEVRTSKSLRLARVIGPTAELSKWEAAEALSMGRPEPPVYPADSSTTLEIVGAVEEGQGITCCFEMTADEPQDHVFFQFAFHFIDNNSMVLARVVTVRLPTTGSVPRYLASVQQDTAAVMMVKRTVVAADSPDAAAEQRTWVEARAKDLAIKLGKPVPRSRMLHFPNELPRIVEALYFLRRGPLLGQGGVAAAAQQAVLREVFLRASLEPALRMAVPRLIMHRPGRPPLDVPPADLAMRSDVALLLDVGTDLIIWIGAELSDAVARATEAECQQSAAVICARRFPVPCIHVLREGIEGGNDMLLPLLMPAHKDPLAQQELRFPPLREMLPDERGRLKAKQQPTSEESFCEWMRRLNLVAPDPQ